MIPTHLRCSLSALLLFSSVAVAQSHPSPSAPQQARADLQQARADRAYGKLPLAFEPNRGQAGLSPDVQFLARGSHYSVLLEPRAATLILSHEDMTPAQAKAALVAGKPVASTRANIRMTLDGANAHATMSPDRALPGYVSYMTGGDRSKWQLGLPTYAATRVAQAYPGIDLVYYGNERQLEYDFVVSPNADPGKIHLAVEGARPTVEASGELRLQIAATRRDTDIVFRKPVLYQKIDGSRKLVDGAFTVAANGEVGFKVGSYDHARELVIDPIISYASYFGGSAEDEINGSTLNASDQLYAVGQTFSSNLPATAGEFQSAPLTGANKNGHDAFVTKFSADGSTVLWTTYLGGSQDDFATGVAVNGSDQAYVVGYTNSCGTPNTVEFPFTSDAVQQLCNPQVLGFNNFESNGSGYDAYLVKLSSDGKSEIYGTPLGGSGFDIANSVALDAAENVYIVGETISTQYTYAVSSNLSDIPSYPINNHGVASIGTANYPTTSSAFYTNTTESKLYTTTDSNGNVFGPQDEQAFLTVLSPDGHSLVYSSLIGGGILGGCGNGDCNTNGIAIALNAKGNAFIGGNTSSAHWPTTTGAFATTCANAGAANSQCAMTGWLAGFDATKAGTASLLFSTYINGSSGGKDPNGNTLDPGSDVFGLTTDSNGDVIATGDTGANNFPTTAGVLQPACVQFSDGNGNSDRCTSAYITKLAPNGSTVWSTYYGPTTQNGGGVTGQGVAVDANNNVYVVGTSTSSSLLLKNPIVSSPSNVDAFLIGLSSNASTLDFGTYLGAGGGITVNNNSLHLDSNLSAYFTGSQGNNPYGGTSFPISANAADKTLQGDDGWVVKMITQQQASATALTVSPGSATPTQTVTLTATVTTPSTLTGSILPTGAVTFLNGTTTLGTGTLNASGVATYAGQLAGGTYKITANYAGDSGFNPSVSSAVSLVVSNAVATTTTLTATPASSTYGAGTTFTAKVLAGSTPATAGTVSFAAGSVTFGMASVNAQGIATLAARPGAGTYSVVATYAGTYNPTTNPTGFAPSASSGVAFSVTKSASMTVLTSSAPSAGPAAKLTLTATVTPGATGTVTFYNGTTSLGTGTLATSGTATLVTSFATAGSYSLTAVYAGDANFTQSTSAVLTQVILTPGFTAALSPTSLTLAAGTSGTTVLTVTPTGGFTGAVTLACGTLPASMTCTFSPATVTLSGAAVPDTLTIATGSASAMLASSSSTMLAGVFGLPAMLLGLLVTFHRKKLYASTRQTIMLAALLFVSLGAVVGCGSSTKGTTPSTNDTPAGSYTVPVTATSGSTTITLNLQITVQ